MGGKRRSDDLMSQVRALLPPNKGEGYFDGKAVEGDDLHFLQMMLGSPPVAPKAKEN